MIIEGTIERLVYRNNKNSYTVARLGTDDGTMTIVGYIPMQSPGASVRLRGEMVEHETYGEQFSVSKVLDIDADYSNNMEAYLKSGAITGVGPAIADRIIKKFGEETYDVFKNEPERLMEVHGIGKKTYEKIIDSFNSQADLNEILIELTSMGLTPAASSELFKRYGENIVTLIKENPYRLMGENVGIGFNRADEIALKSGVEITDPNRVSSCAKYLLDRSKDDGHTYLPLDELVDQLSHTLKLEKRAVEYVIEYNTMGQDIWLMNQNGEERAYLIDLSATESHIGLKLKTIDNEEIPSHNINTDHYIDRMQSLGGFEFADKQKTAIHEAFNNNLLIITGGPGTGKTTTLNAILEIAADFGISYKLAAPTGRAAKKMSEATGREAMTIHRLLEYRYNGYQMVFERNEENPLQQQMIIIDEMSMVDTYLFSALLSAIQLGARLIMLGDVDQLPSVGPGNVLTDIIYSGRVPIVRLDEIFRQEEGSHIVDNAHRINVGAAPLVNQKDSDFFFLETSGQSQTLSTIKELINKRLPTYYNVDPQKDIQVLTPMRKGIVGTENLNKEIQSHINPRSIQKPELQTKDGIFRVGDKVMQNKNNYEAEWIAYTDENVEYDRGLGVYNGDIGTVVDINEDSGTLLVDFDLKKIEYSGEDLEQLELAYAITIHKSQGSEFPVVVIPIHYTPYMLGNRNLIYTGITRGAKLVVLVGKKQRLLDMIENTYMSKRYTSLSERIVEMSWIMS